MNRLAAWLAPGVQGFGKPGPLEFASLVLPRSPNACLALPEGQPGRAVLRTPPLAAAPAAVFEALLALAAAEPRTTLLAAWPERRQAQWVVRSPRLRFPDVVVAEAQPGPGGGTALFLYSRSLIGWSDLGVNQARVARWLAALAASLPAALGPPAEDGMATEAEPEPGPSRFARALAARAIGREVLITGPAQEAPALLLQALAAGALGARVLHAPRPAGADAQLLAAGRRLGLAEQARGVLEVAGLGESNAPPPPFARSDAPPCWWRAEALATPDLAARLGPVDLVADATGLHLCPEPLRHLLGLRRTGARWLLLATAVLPPEGVPPEGLGAELVAAGTLDAAASARLDAALRAEGLALPQLTTLPGGLTEEGARAAGLAAPWWWFMTEAGAAALLAEAGWTLRAARREGFDLLVEAQAAP